MHDSLTALPRTSGKQIDDCSGQSCLGEERFEQALNYPGLRLLPLTPQIAVESTRLQGEFHRDPADQMITATARAYGCPLVTSDRKLLEYPDVTTTVE
jgi:PIN domain nuclease of toxin-antitoxin system